jgi:hypothetical protein
LFARRLSDVNAHLDPRVLFQDCEFRDEAG